MIFVFGSNLAGIHGAGAALHAKIYCRAMQGVGEGRTGNSYALPTKDYNIKTRPLSDIAKSVDTFIEYAKDNPELQFEVTKVGCGLAGYTNEQIAPLFEDVPDNCLLAPEWLKILNKTTPTGIL